MRIIEHLKTYINGLRIFRSCTSFNIICSWFIAHQVRNLFCTKTSIKQKFDMHIEHFLKSFKDLYIFYTWVGIYSLLFSVGTYFTFLKNCAIFLLIRFPIPISKRFLKGIHFILYNKITKSILSVTGFV